MRRRVRRRVPPGKAVQAAAFALAACGLTADATIAADAPPEEPAAVAASGTEHSGTDHWSLRSDRLAPMTPREKVVPVSQMPNERRSVRMVYFGYGEANLIKDSH